MEPWGTPERTARDEKRGKGLYIGSINKFPPFDKQWRYQYVIVQIVSCKRHIVRLDIWQEHNLVVANDGQYFE